MPTKAPAAPLALRCEHCNTTSHVPAKYAGRRGKCPVCRASIRVPGVRVRSSSRKGGSQSSRRKDGGERSRSPRKQPVTHTCRYCDEVLGATFHECLAEVEPKTRSEPRHETAAEKLDRVLEEKSQRQTEETKRNVMFRLPLYFMLFMAVVRFFAAMSG